LDLYGIARRGESNTGTCIYYILVCIIPMVVNSKKRKKTFEHTIIASR
jgi:hypothetical protein